MCISFVFIKDPGEVPGDARLARVHLGFLLEELGEVPGGQNSTPATRVLCKS